MIKSSIMISAAALTLSISFGVQAAQGVFQWTGKIPFQGIDLTTRTYLTDNERLETIRVNNRDATLVVAKL